MNLPETNLSRRSFLARAMHLGLGAGLALCLPFGAALATGDDALARWKSMTPEQQEKIRSRFAEYQGMSAAEKQEIRDTYERFNGLTEPQKQTVAKNYESWKTLSPEQQEALRKRYTEWKSMTEEQRAALELQLKAFEGGSGKSAK